MQEVAGLLLVVVVAGLAADRPLAVLAGVLVVVAWEVARVLGLLA